MFKVLSLVHIVAGVLLLPVAALLGPLAAPLLAPGPLWLMVLGFRLWTPTARTIVLLRRTHWCSLAVAGLLAAYGVLALRAAERSAAAGGGLLGGFGLIPLGFGLVLAGVALPSLCIAGRPPRAAAGRTP